MEALYSNMNQMSLLLLATFVAVAVFMLLYSNRHKSGRVNLPPGTMGWPVVGETLEFIRGNPDKFVAARLQKYAPHKAFKTSIFGENMIIMCGSSANKFLFSNENKLVRVWWPKPVQKIITTEFSEYDHVKWVRKILQPFFMPEALQRYIPIMDKIANQHFESEWEGKDQVTVLPLTQRYTFWLACHIFLSIEDSNSSEVTQLFGPFKDITSSITSIPINLPGMTYNRGIKASNFIKKKIKDIVKQRKFDLANGKANPPTQDVLSQMMLSSDEDGRYLSENEIADNILGFLLGGYDTASGVCTLIVNYLAQLPHIYDLVYKEQMEIAKSKEDGDLLNWHDIQKMKYSWNVACEVMRVNPSTLGVYREAIKDFTFDGLQIPKGWKILSSIYTTQWNPECFPNPEKFDPSRFKSNEQTPYTFVPFGGGPRMCIGKEFARLEILVFMHNLVKRFKWDKTVANEKVIMKPFTKLDKGLPICLHPHSHDESVL